MGNVTIIHIRKQIGAYRLQNACIVRSRVTTVKYSEMEVYVEKRKLIKDIQSHRSVLKENAEEKARESVSAVLPIVLIVLILCFTVAALSPGILVEFLIGSVLVILGMIFFSMGAELSMTPMGEHVGGSMLRTKKLGFIVIIGFILGFIITISEPDLQVLAEQVSSVPNLVLILSVALGVGAFLVVALLRILFGIALPPLLFCFYIFVSKCFNIC